MRPNVKTTREVLNVAALPATAGMELDYRTSVHSEAKCNTATLDAILGAVAVAMIWTLVLRLTGAYTATIPFLIGIAFLCVLAALWMRLGAGIALTISAAVTAVLCFTWSPLSLVFILPLALALAVLVWSVRGLGMVPTTRTWVILGPTLWLLSVASNTAFFAVFLIVSVGIVLHLCEAMTRHYALWMNANPYLKRRMRHRWRLIWRPVRRWDEIERLANSLVHPRTCRHPVLAAELAERTRYLLGFVVVIVACLIAVLAYLVCRDPLLRGTLAVGVFLVLLVGYGTVAVLTYGPVSHVPLAAKVMFRALVNWCTYNVHETPAPGVLQSSYGSAMRRTKLLRAAIGTLTIVLLPTCWYFPIGAGIFGTDTWLRAALQSQQNIPSFLKGTDLDASLTAPDQTLLRSVPEERREEVRHRLQGQRSQEAFAREAYRALHTMPEYALVLHLRAVFSLRTEAIFSALLSIAACIAVPVLVLLAIWWAVSARVLLHHHLTLEGDPGRPGTYHPRSRPSVWMAYTSRLRASRFRTEDDLQRCVAERDHLLIGFNELEDYPVLLSPAVLAEHAHITGDSGSGKSSLGIAPLAEQLIERGDCSVVILDLKGDMSMFEAARLASARANARRNGRPALAFRWFTNQAGQSTFVFNPFLQRDMRALTPQQRAEVLLGSLGLDYGEGYGASYYSSAHRHVLKRVLENNPQFQSFRQINAFFQDGRFAVNARDMGIDRKAREEASHLYTVMESLASFDALNVTEIIDLPAEIQENSIDMADVVRAPHVLYFGLASALEQKSVREIAKLALHTLLVAAVRRGHGKHQVYLFVDEFQQVVSHDLEIVLRQARSHGIAAILANQTLSDLKKGPIDITPTVQANTRFRQIFSASDLAHQKMLVDASGEAIYELFGSSQSVGESGGKHVERHPERP